MWRSRQLLSSSQVCRFQTPSGPHARHVQSQYDEELFEWLSMSQLAMIDATAATPRVAARSAPRMFVGLDASPDGSKLLVSWLERPFSYELPVGRFPRVWQVWDRCAAAVAAVLCMLCRSWLRSGRAPPAGPPFPVLAPASQM
jgi:hypothetical protein